MTARTISPARGAASRKQADAVLRELDARRQQLEDELNTHAEGLSDEESDARVDAMTDRVTIVEKRIAAQPAGTIEGLLIKVRLLVHLALPQEKLLDGRMMLAVLADTERLAKGSAARETREKRKLPKPSRRRSRRG